MRRIQRAAWQRPKPAVTVRGSTIDPQLRQLVRGRAGGCCELCGIRVGARSYQCHHRKLRSRGGQDSAANLACLCAVCHRRCHQHPVWATDHGFIVSAYDDPAAVPVALHESRWVLLTFDGHYTDAGEAA